MSSPRSGGRSAARDGDRGSLDDYDHAQAFTTGSNGGGYTLTSMEIEFEGVALPTATYTVTIRESKSSGNPGSLLGTLTGPDVLRARALNTFTASASGIPLAKGTTYYVLVDSSSGGHNFLRNTASDGEDSGGADGWSIADGSLYRNKT